MKTKQKYLMRKTNGNIKNTNKTQLEDLSFNRSLFRGIRDLVLDVLS